MIQAAAGQTFTVVGTLTTYDAATDAYVALTTPDTVTLKVQKPDGTSMTGLATPTQVGSTNKFQATFTAAEAGVYYAQIVAVEGTATGLNRRLAATIDSQGSIS